MRIVDGVIILVVGAGIISLATWLWRAYWRRRLENRSYKWLFDNTEDNASKQFKSTAEIARALHVECKSVRRVAESSPSIYQPDDGADEWGVWGTKRRSPYEDRGVEWV